jgi:hypothetical protein
MLTLDAKFLLPAVLLSGAFSIEVQFLLKLLPHFIITTYQLGLGISISELGYKTGIAPGWMELSRLLYVRPNSQ